MKLFIDQNNMVTTFSRTVMSQIQIRFNKSNIFSSYHINAKGIRVSISFDLSFQSNKYTNKGYHGLRMTTVFTDMFLASIISRFGTLDLKTCNVKAILNLFGN